MAHGERLKEFISRIINGSCSAARFLPFKLKTPSTSSLFDPRFHPNKQKTYKSN